jgi:hypothetical protein
LRAKSNSSSSLRLCSFASLRAKSCQAPLRPEIEPREWNSKAHTRLLAAKPRPSLQNRGRRQNESLFCSRHFRPSATNNANFSITMLQNASISPHFSATGRSPPQQRQNSRTAKKPTKHVGPLTTVSRQQSFSAKSQRSKERKARLLRVFAPLRLCALNRGRPQCDKRPSVQQLTSTARRLRKIKPRPPAQLRSSRGTRVVRQSLDQWDVARRRKKRSPPLRRF